MNTRKLWMGILGLTAGFAFTPGVFTLFFYIFVPGATMGHWNRWMSWWWVWLIR